MITDPNQEYFKNGVWGYGPSGWTKLPLVWGFNAIYHERYDNDNPGTVNPSAVLSTVPSGEIWVMNSVSARNMQGTTVRIELQVVISTVKYNFHDKFTLAVAELCAWSGHLVLEEGNHLNCNWVGLQTDADNIRFFALGYKMKV